MMKKRLLSAILSGCMLLTAFPSAYAVSPAPSAGIVQNAQTYAATNGTMLTASSQTLTDNEYYLDNDTTLNGHLEVPAGQRRKMLDLNNHELTPGSNEDYTIVVQNGANLTLIGAGSLISGKLGAVKVENGGTFTLSGGAAAVISGAGGITVEAGGRVEVNGGKINTRDAAIRSEAGSNSRLSSTITISDGTLTASRSASVYLPAPAALTITGGDVSGIGARTGEIKISDGAIHSISAQSFDSVDKIDNLPLLDCPILPSAIYLLPGSQQNTSTQQIALTISGGTVASTENNGYGVGVYVSGGRAQSANVQISGGTITSLTSQNASAIGLHYRDGSGSSLRNNWNSATVSVTGGNFSDDLKNSCHGLPASGVTAKTIPNSGYVVVNSGSGNAPYEVKSTVNPNTVKVTGDDGTDASGNPITSDLTGSATITDAQGNTITALTPGQTYNTLNVAAPNYWTTPFQNVTVQSNGTANPTLQIKRKQTGMLKVTPNLYNEEKPASGTSTTQPLSPSNTVTVSIYKGSSQTPVDTKTCGSTDSVVFANLDVGETYTVKCAAVADGYEEYTATVTIPDDPAKQDSTQDTFPAPDQTVDLYQTRGSVTFNVTEDYNGNNAFPVTTATVSIWRGSDNTGTLVARAPSADIPTYRLELDSYYYELTAPYYTDKTGADTTITGAFTIDASNAANGIKIPAIELKRLVTDLEVTVALSEDPNPATRAADDITVKLEDTVTGGASETKTILATDTNKKVTFQNVRRGATYTLTVSKADYDTKTETVLINGNAQQQKTITLYHSRGLSELKPMSGGKEVPGVNITVWEGADDKGVKIDRDEEDLNTWKFSLKANVKYYYRAEALYYETKEGDVTGILTQPFPIEMKQIEVPVTITPNVEGATITVVDENGDEVNPTNGKYVLTIGKNYKYSVSATGYRPKKDIALTAAASTTEIKVELSPLSAAYTAVFEIKTAGGKPIANATVTIDTKTAVTGINGQCSVDGLTNNSYNYTIAANGYKTAEGTINDAFNRETDQYVISKTLEAETYPVRFIFQAGSETVNPGAALTVRDGDGIAVQPNADGTYTLKQPEVSQYIVKNNPSTFDYHTVSGTIQYDASAQGVRTITVPLTKVAHDYQVTFQVRGQAAGVTPVVKYGEGTATTDIPATENGYTATLQNNRSYVYTVSAEGYQTVSSTIALKDNQTAEIIPVYLVETGKVFTLQLNLYSTDATVSNPAAANTNIIMKDSEGNIISPIDSTGNRFYLDTTKTYTYTVVADGFAPVTGKIEAGTTTGMVKEELIALTPYSRNYTLEFAVTSADGSTPSEVKITVKEKETNAEQTINNNKVTLLNNHAYTYTVTASGKNTVSGTINTKTDTTTEVLSIVLTNKTTVPETKVSVKNDTPWTGGSAIEQAAIVAALAQTEIPSATAAAIGAAAEKNRTAILQNAGADNQSATLYLQTYLQIEPKSYTATADGKSLVVDIKPMVQVVEATGTPFVFPGDVGETNAKYVGNPQQLYNITEAMRVTVTLPSSFVTDIEKDWVYINHNAVEHTRSHMDTNNQVHFMTTGFSPFTFSTKDTSGNVAYIQETGRGFTSLQAAAEQVKDGQTIEVTAAGTLEATVNRVVNFYATTPNGASITIRDGYGAVIEPLDTLYVVSAVNPDTPDNPDNPDNPVDPDNNPTNGYRIRVTHGSHGSVSVSHSRAKSGTTVTVTIRPDAGYEMADIEVLDDNQDSITTRRRTDEEYTFRMPDSTVTVDVSFRSYESNRADTSDDVTTEHGAVPFPDVQRKDWFYSAVKYVYDRGIMDGKGVGFVPNGPVTRGMVVTILYRMDGKPSASESQFSDVQPGQYYSVPVSWAARHDIVNGYGNGQFRPNDSITREQFATILYRFAQYKNYSTSASSSLLQYTDASNISDFALDAMRWANGNRLITGVTETALMPGGNATRAQAAAIIQRFCKEVAYY